MMDTQITIQWGPVDEEDGYNEWSYRDGPIPAVGSHFSALSQKDAEGNYLNDSILGTESRPIISGRVIDIRYHIEGRGQNRENWKLDMWVFVVIEPDEHYWEGSQPQ
jgi:hypothetical protein